MHLCPKYGRRRHAVECAHLARIHTAHFQAVTVTSGVSATGSVKRDRRSQTNRDAGTEKVRVECERFMDERDALISDIKAEFTVKKKLQYQIYHSQYVKIYLIILTMRKIQMWNSLYLRKTIMKNLPPLKHIK